MLGLKNLPFPKVIEELSYDEILSGNEKIFKEYLGDDEISLLESDNYKALLETLSYRETILRARINSAVRAMLLPFSTGSDLDNVVAIYGTRRLKGAKPYAKVEFSLTMKKDSDTIIPKGVILSSVNGKIAILKDSVTIKTGELKAAGITELSENTKTSKEKCELIQTPLPFLTRAKQISDFSGGSDEESDEALRKRAVLSLERFSTAGARKAYIYHTLSASAKVKEVNVINGGPGVVEIYIKSTDESEETLKEIKEYLSAENRRPLTDNIKVFNAVKIPVTIKAEIELTDLSFMNDLDKRIKNARADLGLGEDLNISYIYDRCHENDLGVYRVNLKNPLKDIKIAENEYVLLKWELSYKAANL